MASTVRLIAIALALVLAGCGAAARPVDLAPPTPPRTTVTVAQVRVNRKRHAEHRDRRRAHLRRHRHVVVRAVKTSGRPVSVWLPWWAMSAALDSTVANSALIGTASPFWYSIAGDANVKRDQGAGDRAVIADLRAHGIKVVPTVSESDGLRAFDALLASPAKREAMVRALVSIARGSGYSGLDLDFEDFAVDPKHNAALANAAAAGYPTLVSEACSALHAIARSCAVTVMPRTGTQQVYWRGFLATWVYDYSALANAADQVQIMAYDQHAPGTHAGPVSPYGWVQQVTAYARATMPGDRVELALPAYGYAWSGTKATVVTAAAAPALAAAHHVHPAWDATQAEETFSYRVRKHHRFTVWYENAAANLARVKLATAAGFAAVGIWTAGYEDPSLWPLLRSFYDR